MSILDKGKLATQMQPRTIGDQLPGRAREPYKDGVEEKWTDRESKAIRGLAAGYHPSTVAKRCRISDKTLEIWMGNPYFMAAVITLTDHSIFRYRAAVLESLARRAIAGSAPHIRLFMLFTKDLDDSSLKQPAGKHADEFDKIPPERVDDKLLEELEKSIRG